MYLNERNTTCIRNEEKIKALQKFKIKKKKDAGRRKDCVLEWTYSKQSAVPKNICNKEKTNSFRFECAFIA